eukprot:Plantae.Rhodophyta-Palmaria_palmata.ctg2347.p1 GENE.Plantae.Rhodophyta-Palmaria_palmata.ctg2347~~Plantae.Rhodophyta-Palmaria_palmata.ctg2347.p1  ORF type:complete len:222 (+),score=20.89 Plantae.Rhodophyta-Palmaria_palmata.ctg2347:3-668(+)
MCIRDRQSTGEAEWASTYPTCGAGTRQSPIDVPSCHSRSSCDKPKVTIYDSDLIFHSENNNFATDCNTDFSPCSQIDYNDTMFSMVQMHMHSPAENKLNGEEYPLGMHLVHKSEDGDLAVLDIAFKIGKWNEQIEAMLIAGVSHGTVRVDLKDLYWEHSMICVFTGSLTTPPCTEGVTWFVSWGVHQLSADQLFRFQALMPSDHSNRPIQPINGRDISCTH